MENNRNPADAVTVIGLGAMGSAIAKIFLSNNYHVTVWNRTIEKAAPLVKKEASLSQDVSSAVSASPVIIICVHDYKATEEIFHDEVVALKLSGKTVIQLTTGSPREAKDAEAWFNQYNAEYLDGAIQVAPDQMAKPDTTILLSGSERTYTKTKELFDILGGNVTFLGDKINSAATMDLATLSYVYGSALGFFQGALIAEAEGFSVSDYGSIVANISPSMGEFLKHEGKVIQDDDFTISQSPLSISIAAVKRIEQTTLEAGINADFLTFTKKLFEKAFQEGLADQEVAALIKVLRKSE